MLRCIVKIGLLSFVTCCALPSTVRAQGAPAAPSTGTPRANGPFSGLFGASSSPSHALDLFGSMFAAYQEVLLPPAEREAAALDPLFQQSQTFEGASAGLTYMYNRHGNRSFFNVSGNGAVADYSIRPDVIQYSAGASASTGIFGQMSPKIHYTTSVGASYAPYLGYSPFSSALSGSVDQTFVGPQFGVAATPSQNLSVTGGAQITDQLSRRSSLSASLDYSRLFVLGDAGVGYEGRTGTFRYTHQFFRRLYIYGGYRYSEYRYAASDQVSRQQGADIGFNYGDSLTLQLGQHTTASFFGSVTGATGTDGVGPHASTSTHYAGVGSASIEHTMGRSWSSAAAYYRSLTFVAFFDQPMLTDTATGSLSGLLAPRLSWHSAVGWVRGQVGFGDRTANNGLNATYASSSLTFGVTQRVGLYAQYLYYRFELPTGPYTRIALPTHSARQIVSVGLSAYLPIFHHERHEGSQ